MINKNSLKTLRIKAEKLLNKNIFDENYDFELACDLSNLLDTKTTNEFFQEASRSGLTDLFFNQEKYFRNSERSF